MNLFRNRNKKFEDDLQKQLSHMEVKPSRSLWDKLDEELEQGGFEQKVQSKLDHFEMVPYSDTWTKIESQLPLEPEPKFWLRYLGASLVALLFVSGIFVGYEINKQQSSLAVVTEQPPQTATNSNTDNDIPTAEKGVNNNRPENNAEQTLRSEQAVMPKSSDMAKKPAKIVGGSNKKPEEEPGLSTSETVADADLSSAYKPMDKLVTKSTHSKPVISEENKVSPIRESKGTAQISTESPGIAAKSKAVQSKRPIPEKVDQAISSPVASVNNVQRPETNVAASQVSKGIAPELSPSTNQVVTRADGVLADSLPASKEQQGIKGNVVNEVVSLKPDSSVQVQASETTGNDKYDSDKPGRFSLVIMVGGHYSFNNLSAPSSSSLSFDENVKLRKGLEKPKPDWSGGFLADYMLTDRFRIAGGIAMLNFTQEFYYDIVPAKGNTNGPGEVGAGVLNPNDSIVGGNSFSNTIRYSWTEIPLLFTYQLTRGTKWNIELQGGLSYAMLTSVNASLVSYDNTGLLVLSDKDAFPGLQNSFFAIFNPTLTYSLNEKVIFGLMPTVKYSLNSMVKNDQWVQQYPYFIGVSASLRRRF